MVFIVPGFFDELQMLKPWVHSPPSGMMGIIGAQPLIPVPGISGYLCKAWPVGPVALMLKKIPNYVKAQRE
jgi:hypothetical protein